MEIRDFRLQGPDATHRAGTLLGEVVEAGDLIGLVGDLGAGKTSLVQGLVQGLALAPETPVTSPTFTLVNEYHGGTVAIYHADLYRIEHAIELDEIGLDEICRRGDGVVCVEWCDRFSVLGAHYVEVRLRVTGEDERTLDAIGHGPRSQKVVAAWREALLKR